MLFSVIIPVYQAEKTIARCLESLLSQAADDVELLLVDDGSSDRSPEICDRYAAEHPNIRCIHQANQGVSAARNAALDMARGEFLLFVDSDDYVSNKYFSVIRRELTGGEQDLLSFSCATTAEKLGTSAGKRSEAVTQAETAVMFADLLREQYLGSLWNKCFRRSIVERYHIRFLPALRISEDLTFIFTYLLHAKGIRCFDDRLYFYTVDDAASLSKKQRTYLTEHLLTANNEMRSQLGISSERYSKRDLRVIGKALDWNYYRNAYTAIRELDKFSYSKKEKKDRAREICKRFSDPSWKPSDLRSAALAFPIRHRMTDMIDRMMGALIK